MKVQLTNEEFCGIVNVLAESDALEELREALKNNKLIKVSDNKLEIEVDEKYIISALEIEKKYFPSIIGMGKALVSTLKNLFNDIRDCAEARNTALKVAEVKEEK